MMLMYRLIIVSNVLPIRAKRESEGVWSFEWDEDALVAQAKVRIPRAGANIEHGALLQHQRPVRVYLCSHVALQHA